MLIKIKNSFKLLNEKLKKDLKMGGFFTKKNIMNAGAIAIGIVIYQKFIKQQLDKLNI